MKKGIIAIISALVGMLTGAVAVFRIYCDKIKREKELNSKNDAILKVFNQWFSDRQKGKTVVDFFAENGYKTIAIYGMHYLGECLYEELKNSEIEVKYAIDKNAQIINGSVDVYTLEDYLPKVDAIVVTAFYYFDDIEKALRKKINCPIISLEDIIYEF